MKIKKTILAAVISVLSIVAQAETSAKESAIDANTIKSSTVDSSPFLKILSTSDAVYFKKVSKSIADRLDIVVIQTINPEFHTFDDSRMLVTGLDADDQRAINAISKIAVENGYEITFSFKL